MRIEVLRVVSTRGQTAPSIYGVNSDDEGVSILKLTPSTEFCVAFRLNDGPERHRKMTSNGTGLIRINFLDLF